MKIYTYDNITDFLNQMEYLGNEYDKINYYFKYVPDKYTMMNQLHYIRKRKILSSSGFYSQRIVKLTIEDDNKKYCITYRFSNKQYYKFFRLELKKLEQIRNS